MCSLRRQVDCRDRLSDGRRRDFQRPPVCKTASLQNGFSRRFINLLHLLTNCQVNILKQFVFGFYILASVLMCRSIGFAQSADAEESRRIGRVACLVHAYHKERRTLRENELHSERAARATEISENLRRLAEVRTVYYFDQIQTLDQRFNERFSLIVATPPHTRQYAELVEHLAGISPEFGKACP